jgi:hypothetical protein
MNNEDRDFIIKITQIIVSAVGLWIITASLILGYALSKQDFDVILKCEPDSICVMEAEKD